MVRGPCTVARTCGRARLSPQRSHQSVGHFSDTLTLLPRGQRLISPNQFEPHTERDLRFQFHQRPARDRQVVQKLLRPRPPRPFRNIRRNRHRRPARLRRQIELLTFRKRRTHPIYRLGQLHRNIPQIQVAITTNRHTALLHEPRTANHAPRATDHGPRATTTSTSPSQSQTPRTAH